MEIVYARHTSAVFGVYRAESGFVLSRFLRPADGVIWLSITMATALICYTRCSAIRPPLYSPHQHASAV